MAKPSLRIARTPEQQAIYDDLDQAWKIAARAIAADLPVHVPASVIRKALAANMREIEPLTQLWQKYRASLEANHPIRQEDPWATHDRGCRTRALGAQGECNCSARAVACE